MVWFRQTLRQSFWTIALAILLPAIAFAQDEGDSARVTELDRYWKSVSRAVATGDFEAYQQTFHADAVLVSGVNKKSYPIAEALKRWHAGFEDTRQGKIQAKVEFKFARRVGDTTTAHETGIFLYSTVDQDGKPSSAHIHFEALLVKKDGRWLAMMEYQKSKATEAQWAALAK